MGANDRPFGNVLQDIVANLQGMVRAELRLAKAELKQELNQARLAIIVLGVGIASALFALFFLLVAVLYALMEEMPRWAASVVVALGLSLCGGIAIMVGLKRFKQIHIAPKTIETLKENVQWAKPHTK